MECGRNNSPQRTQRGTAGLTFREEFPYAKAHLDGVEAGIGRGQTCVRDVHVAEFQAHVVSLAENMRAQRGLVHKVHRIGSCRHVVIRKDHTAG